MASPKLRSSIENDGSTSQPSEDLNLENDQHNSENSEGQTEKSDLSSEKSLPEGHQPKRIRIMPDVNFKKMLHNISFDEQLSSSEDESINEDVNLNKPNWTGTIYANVENIDKFNANIYAVSGKFNFKVNICLKF